MKKLLLLFLALTVVFTLLTSCNKGGGSAANNVDYMDPTQETIWSYNNPPTIVVDEETPEVTSLMRHFYGIIAKAAPVKGYDSDPVSHEIVIGKCDRGISEAAYYRLDRYADTYALSESGDSAYLIYASHGSIAIAYSDVFARNAAIDYFLANLDSISYRAGGIIHRTIFDTEKYVEEQRTKYREEYFTELAKVFDEEIIAAMRNIYKIYDQDVYLWMANLYDPEIGGFYYSISARDNETFLPDLESTGQALAFIDNSGLSTGYTKTWFSNVKASYAWQYLISDKMKEELISFVTSLDPDGDGNYTHPQWDKVGINRQSRDNGWALRILTVLDAKNRTVAMESTVMPRSAALTGKLSASSVQSAVGSVISSAVATPAASFSVSSWEDLKAYLDENFVPGKTYDVAHTLNSNVSKVKNAGLMDELLDYLDEKQNPENGLWEPEVNYSSVSALMKVSNFYDSTEHPLPNADKAIQSAIQVIEDKNFDTCTAVVYIYNPWYSIDAVLSSCSKDDREDFREYFRNNAKSLIDDTMKKLLIFAKDDGGFSYKPESSAEKSQGASVAVINTPESDVNATSIAVSTLNRMMEVLLDGTGLEAPTVFGRYDGYYFIDVIDGLDQVEKKPYNGPEPETESFDDYDSKTGGEANGVTLYPSEFIDINLGNTDIGLDGNFKFFSTAVVDNPDGTPGDKVLMLKSLVYDSNGDGVFNVNGVECAGTNSNMQANIINMSALGNCYIFETDLYFDDCAITSGTAMQLMFNNSASYNPLNSFWLNFNAKQNASGEKYLIISENFGGPDGTKTTDLIGSIPAKTWTKLRVEMYKIYDDNGRLTVTAKIFVNGKYLCKSDSSNYSASVGFQDYEISSVRFSCFRTAGSCMYLDDVFAGKANKEYVAEVTDNNNFDSTVAYPDSYDFENDVKTGILYTIYKGSLGEYARFNGVKIDAERFEGHNDGLFLSIIKQSDNKVLMIDSKSIENAAAAEIMLDTQQIAGKRVHILEYDYYFESNSSAAELIKLELYDVNGNVILSPITLAYNAKTGGDKGELRMHNSTAVEQLDAKTWYKFRVVVDTDGGYTYYQFSSDGGANWFVGTVTENFLSRATVAYAKMLLTAAGNTGVQYIDNIKYSVSDTVPEAKVIVSDMAAAVSPTNTIVYDFSNAGATLYSPGSYNLYITTVLKVGDATHNLVVGTDEYNKLASENGKDNTTDLIGGKGSLYYIVNDPVDSANKVLQIVTRAVGGANSHIDILASVTTENVRALELTFDYYTDYYSFAGKNFPSLCVILWDGQYEITDSQSNRNFACFANPTESGSANSRGEKYTVTTSSDGEIVTDKLTGAMKISSKVLDSHTWYTIKMIIFEGKQYLYYAVKGSGNFELISQTSYTKDINQIKYARLQINSYNNTSRQYIDNISFVKTGAFVDPTAK